MYPPKSTTSILESKSILRSNNNDRKKQTNSFSARVKPVKAVLNQYHDVWIYVAE